MSNCEHLLENALNAMIDAENSGKNEITAFYDAMKEPINADMLDAVHMTQNELCDIVVYVLIHLMDIDHKRRYGGEND